MMLLRFASPAFSIVASGFLVSGLFAPSVSAFSDVPATHESRRAIEYLQREGVLGGYADGQFRPAFPINRAELLKVLVAARGDDPLAAEYGNCFPDVGDQWFARYVCFAVASGWVQGYPDGTFGPERPVTFVEALKMLSNVRGYPPAPAEESRKRGLDPAAWYAPYLTTALLIDIVSYDQVFGAKAMPLQASLGRGFVAQLLYRALLAEGSITTPLFTAGCATSPSHLEIRTFVDVLVPSKTNIFRQDLYGVDDAGGSCLLVTDANPFGRVGFPLDPIFLQPYPDGQPEDSWTARAMLHNGRATLRGGTLQGAFRPEVFVADVLGGTLRQLPSIFASPGGSIESHDRRFVVYVGVTGRSLEAIDLVAGSHMVLDSLAAPLTFFSSSDGGQSVSFPTPGSNILSYVVYEETAAGTVGYTKKETRTADVEALFGVTQFNPFDPFNDPSYDMEDEDPFAPQP